MVRAGCKGFNWLAVLLAVLLSGCERGPATDVLQQALQERLDTHFQQDLFSVPEFRRTGSAPFRNLEDGTSGVYAYFDAELEFLQDYSLSDWRELNLGTLAYAIGAAESGIEGFRAQGNERGDLLRVHGRFAYKADGEGGWVSLDQQSSPRPSGKPQAPADSPGPNPESVLAAARSLLGDGYEYKVDSRAALVVEELRGAIDRIDLRTATLEGKITLGSGTAQGTYYSFGEALSRYAGQRGIALFNAASEGSLENASRLQASRLDFGLVQSDVAQLLHRGLTSAGFYPYNELRAVASLWPEAVHLLTLEGSGITQLSDLKGRRVAVGERGSGSRVNALLIGLAAELNGDPLPAIREISLARGIAQLEKGEVDALFLTEAIPAPAVQKLASYRNDLRFVPMPTELFAKLAQKHYAYYPLTVPARTYPGQLEPFTTFGLAAALVTHRNVEDKKVEQMLELLTSGGDELARKYYRAAFISSETMRLGLAVPLHPAAERFYERYQRQQEVDSK
ncbi:MAG: TAXI family TRAP transporter solute-binding subunit [Halioglobus sp.]|nr:TAXI family TRAP transporter solute-binding subunit [Halioglobus sp.]MBP6725143.1 TAXI family TRAP transporter solute-binding subunit [Halioglobus sp.]